MSCVWSVIGVPMECPWGTHESPMGHLLVAHGLIFFGLSVGSPYPKAQGEK